MFLAVQGNADFRKSKKYTKSQPFFKSLEKGQDPKVFFITCADSRVVPTLFTKTKPGQLFTHRNVGNIIPEYSVRSSESASIEYALTGLNPTDIILCGHTQCGAMQGLLNPALIKNMPAVNHWLTHSKDVLNTVNSKYPGVADKQRLQKTVEENVLLQIKNLKTHPSVKEALAKNTVKIHAWVYNIATCEILAYDQNKHQFLPVEQSLLTIEQSSDKEECQSSCTPK